MEICTPNRIGLLFLFILVFVCGCSKSARVADSAPKKESVNIRNLGLDDEEYAVYSALISDMYVRDGSKSITILIETRASKSPHSDLAETLQRVRGGIAGGITSDVINDFLEKNLQPSPLTNRFNSIGEYRLLSREEVERIFQKGGGWVEYHSNYHAQGIVELSRVGFSHGGEQALVYTGIQSGLKTGVGYYVLLVKESEGWRIKDKVEIWAS